MVAVALLPSNDVIEEDGASKGRLRTEAEDGLADGRMDGRRSHQPQIISDHRSDERKSQTTPQ